MHEMSDTIKVTGATGQHTIRKEEQAAFADWINRTMHDDKDVKAKLPLHTDGEDLYEKCRDSVLLCKLINKATPGTIFDKAINFPPAGKELSIYQRLENGNLVLNSARALGCKIVNIEAADIDKRVPYLVLGLIWQVIKIGLLSEITLAQHAELVVLLEEHETLDDLRRLSPEQLIMRWVNYQMNKAGVARRMGNFEGDLQDSEIFIRLIRQVAPEDKMVNQSPVLAVCSSFLWAWAWVPDWGVGGVMDLVRSGR